MTDDIIVANASGQLCNRENLPEKSKYFDFFGKFYTFVKNIAYETENYRCSHAMETC